VKKLICPLLLLVMVFALTALAAAEDDDSATTDDDSFADDDSGEATTFEDSTLDFFNPTALDAEVEYLFEFIVENKATPIEGEKLNWIKAVELTLPSGYTVNEEDEEALTAPDPLHSPEVEEDPELQIDRWEVMFDPDSTTITWQAFGVVTSVEFGDIREGETLPFAFKATTDAVPTDGFAWVLRGDEGVDVSGISYIEDEEPGDDDTEPSDDDSEEGPSPAPGRGDTGGGGGGGFSEPV
jgi:hypothetical protein